MLKNTKVAVAGIVVVIACLMLNAGPGVHAAATAEPPADTPPAVEGRQEKAEPHGGQAADAPAEHTRIRVDEQGRTIVEDGVNRYRLSLPAPYWECNTPAQLLAEAEKEGQQGCSRRRGASPGLLLIISNKDASPVAYLNLLQERFLMRGKDDLENYVNFRQQQLLQQSKGAVKFLEPSFQPGKGIITHRSVFTVSGGKEMGKCMLVHYFVRPKGEDVHIYQLGLIATEKEFERQQEDFEHIITGFKFTGELAAEFFAPDAPASRLFNPEQAQQPGSSMCGQGYSGMLIAVVGVLFIYMLMRRRKAAA